MDMFGDYEYTQAELDQMDMEADMAYERMRDNDSDALYTELEAMFKKWMDGGGYFGSNPVRFVETAIAYLKEIAKVKVSMSGENIYAHELEQPKVTVDYVNADPKDDLVV